MKTCIRYAILFAVAIFISTFTITLPAFAATSIRHGWIALDANKNPVLQGSEYQLSNSEPIFYITNGNVTIEVNSDSVIYLGNTKPGVGQALIIGDTIPGYEDAFITTFILVKNADANTSSSSANTSTNSNAANTNPKTNTNTSTNTKSNTNTSTTAKANTNTPTNTKANTNTSSSSTNKKSAAKTYTITYQLDGGTNAKGNPSSYTAGKAVKLANPIRSGYTFKGWYSDAVFSKKVTSITAKDSGNKTLYAKWERKYTITYKLAGGTNSSGNPASYNEKTATIKLSNPKRAGYSFKGWYLDSKYKTKVTTIDKGSKGNKTLYAKWEVISYPNISAKTDRATNIKTMTARYKDYPNGGIAIVGTSYMSGWDAEITFDNLGYDAGKVYNFAIGGDKPSSMGVDQNYINMIAAKAPRVIVINGANDFAASPKDSSKNQALVNKTYNGQINLIKNLRAALKAKGVSNPKFILSSALKTPSRYHKSVASYTASKGPSTCNLWKRVDAYNSKLASFAQANADTTYFDFEPYFYKIINGKVRYYLTPAETASGKPTGRAVRLLTGSQTDVFLGTSKNDMFHHPTKKAHEDIFPALAKIAVDLAQ